MPHRFVTNAAFAIPWTKRFTGYEGKVLDGWTVDGVLTAQSGFPATILSGPVLNIPDVALLGGGVERANGDATGLSSGASRQRRGGRDPVAVRRG